MYAYVFQSNRLLLLYETFSKHTNINSNTWKVFLLLVNIVLSSQPIKRALEDDRASYTHVLIYLKILFINLLFFFIQFYLFSKTKN